MRNLKTSVEYTIKFNYYKQKNKWKNGVKTVVNCDGILWLNGKQKKD